MALKDVDLGAAMRRIADMRIEEAMAEGKFDNLPGAGKPLDLDPMPAEENARATWWALRIMKNNKVIPDEVVWRKQLEELMQTLAKLQDLNVLPHLVTTINNLVRRINTLGTNALNSPILGVDAERERERILSSQRRDS